MMRSRAYFETAAFVSLSALLFLIIPQFLLG
jgi:hypothetical protein